MANEQPQPQFPPARTAAKSQSFLTFVYNKRTGCFGRGCASWAKIGVFYVILYTILSGFFAGLLMALFTTVPEETPVLTIGGGQNILKTPGLAFIPRDVSKWSHKAEIHGIRFSMSDPDSYAGYVAQLRDFITDNEYEDVESVTRTTCDNEDPLVDSCPLGLNRLSECWDSDPDFDFGYSDGKPCFLIKMNKLYNWIPEPYEYSPDNDTIGDRFASGNMPVTCEPYLTKLAGDIQPLGEVSYFPEAGFPAPCFPYCGPAVDYKAPVTMIKFQNVTKGVMYDVWCKLHGQNININRKEGTGSMVFRLWVDE